MLLSYRPFMSDFEREQIQDRVKNIPVYEYETIIVPGKRKERILEELDLLSFNREALYPVLGKSPTESPSSTNKPLCAYGPVMKRWMPDCWERR